MNDALETTEFVFFLYHVDNYDDDTVPHGTAGFEHPESWEQRREHYRMIGHVEIELPHEPGADLDDVRRRALERVYTISQHGGPHYPGDKWPARNGVSVYVDRARSTSVADVIVAPWDDGTPFEVGRGFSFRPIADRNPHGTAGDPLPIEGPTAADLRSQRLDDAAARA
jgi:hypothetical protein